MRRIVLSLFIANIVFASDAIDKEQVIIGKWITHAPRRADRIVIFHPDHTWGVTNFDPAKREEIHGRRWRVQGDKLFVTVPVSSGDRPGLDTHAYKIISFRRDKFTTDAFTYTRIK
jgi:hypothetical protein